MAYKVFSSYSVKYLTISKCDWNLWLSNCSDLYKNLLRLREKNNALQLPVFFLWFSQSYLEYREFGAENCFTDHRTANAIHGFRDSVAVLKTRLLWGYAKIWATFHSCSNDTRRLQCVDVKNPLQALLKHFKLYILSQIVR